MLILQTIEIAQTLCRQVVVNMVHNSIRVTEQNVGDHG